MTAVAINVPLKNVMTPRTNNTIIINHHASPSSPSVILIAFTILIVKKKVMIGVKRPRVTLPAIGQKLI